MLKGIAMWCRCIKCGDVLAANSLLDLRRSQKGLRFDLWNGHAGSEMRCLFSDEQSQVVDDDDD